MNESLESSVAPHLPSSTPLTSNNLHKLDPSATPENVPLSAVFVQARAESSSSTAKSVSASTKSELAEQEEEEQEQGSDISHSSMTDNPIKIRNILKQNRTYINDKDGAIVGAEVIKKALEIVDQRRGSGWTATEAKDAKEEILSYAMENEATFSWNFWNVMFNNKRKVPKGELTEEEKLKTENWMEENFSKDHLRVRLNVDFATGSIPKISTLGEPIIDAILAG